MNAGHALTGIAVGVGAAIAAVSPPAVAQSAKATIFVTEYRGAKVYIHPDTILREPPIVRFWAYTEAPSASRRVAAADTYISIDCGAGIYRIYESIRYDRAGDVVSERSYSTAEDPRWLKELGSLGAAFRERVCPR